MLQRGDGDGDVLSRGVYCSISGGHLPPENYCIFLLWVEFMSEKLRESRENRDNLS